MTSGNPLRGMRQTYYFCVHTHTSGVNSNILSAGSSDRGFLLLSYFSLLQRTEKKYQVLSNFSTSVSYVIICFILAQH